MDKDFKIKPVREERRFPCPCPTLTGFQLFSLKPVGFLLCAVPNPCLFLLFISYGRFHEIQKLVDDPILTIKEIHSVRWLSYFEALTAVYRTIDSILTYLAESAHSDYKAQGLKKKIATDTFISTTYMMMDAMAPVTCLSQFFQTQNVDVALVKVKLDQCVDDLKCVRKLDTPYMSLLADHLKGATFKEHRITLTQFSLKKTVEMFTDRLIENLYSRFPMDDILTSFAVLGMRPISLLSPKDLDDFGKEEIQVLCAYYGKQQTVRWKDGCEKQKTSERIIDPEKTHTEWKELKKTVLAEKYPRDVMQDLWMLIYQYHRMDYPNMIKLAALALTSAVHTAGCERGFSTQNKILVKSRSRLNVETQHKLMAVKLTESFTDKMEDCLSVWKSKKSRRIYELSL